MTMRKIVTPILFVSLLACSARAGTLQWSGYEWVIKSSKEPLGPGPNLWSGSEDSVWVDGQGRLNLKLQKIGERWHCAEVYTTKSLGYGKYIFYIDSRVDNLDPNVVAGMFIHLDDMNEIDVEFSKWSEERRYTYHQFTLQPRTVESNIHRTDYRSRSPQSAHGFLWKPTGVAFRSYVGHDIKDKPPYKRWDYEGPDNPEPDTEKVHINLWLYKGQPPAEGNESILVIDKFVFVPLPPRQDKTDAFTDKPAGVGGPDPEPSAASRFGRVPSLLRRPKAK